MRRRPGTTKEVEPPSYPYADHELSSEEVEERYGDLIDAFLLLVEHDPSYLVNMAESGAAIAERRATYGRLWAEKQAQTGR